MVNWSFHFTVNPPFNASSNTVILLSYVKSHKSLNGYLCQETAKEFVDNIDHYIENVILQSYMDSFSNETVFTTMLSDEAMNVYDETKDIKEVLLLEAKLSDKDHH